MNRSGLFPKKLPCFSYKLSSNPFAPHYFLKAVFLLIFFTLLELTASHLLIRGLWGEIKCKYSKIQLIFHVPGTVEFRGLTGK